MIQQTKILKYEKVLVKETMKEDAIGQWLKPAKYELSVVPIYIPVFKITLNVAYGSFEEFKRFMLQEFEHKLEHHDANAFACSFEHKGTTWNFINITTNDWTATDYGTICHELHHATHFSLENMGVTYGSAGEEVYAYMQGYLMELVVRAFVMLRKKTKISSNK